MNQKNRRVFIYFLPLLIAVPLLVSCQINIPTSSENTARSAIQQSRGADIDAELRNLIALNQLTGDPSTNRDLPAIDTPLAQLGKKLFFTKALGGDMDVACVSCHHPLLGGGDDLALSIGIGAHTPDLLGPGRTHVSGRPNVPRNAPTTFNIGMWDQVLFWDGRVESLGKTVGQNGADGVGIRTPDVAFGVADPNAGADLVIAQSRFPVTSRDEMRGYEFADIGGNDEVRQQLAMRISQSDELTTEQLARVQTTNDKWNHQFWEVFGAADESGQYINEQRIATALAAYERSQIFVDTPWKAYIEGDSDALSTSAKRGARLFYNTDDAGGANCASCHVGDFFTDEQFHLLAIPQIGDGKEDDIVGADRGRFRETKLLTDLYTFRTPTLLNVAVTGPYGHNGAFSTLEGIIRHHLDPIESCNTYDMTQIDPAIPVENIQENTLAVIAQLERNRAEEEDMIQNVSLSDSEVADLVAFMQSLTDPCVEDAACLAPWIITEEERGPTSQFLFAQIPSIEGE